MHATLFAPTSKLRSYRNCLGDFIGVGEVVGFAVTRAAGRYGYVPAGGVRGSAVPVFFHREISLAVNFHKSPDDGQIVPGMHHETYHTLELPVLLVVVVGTEEPAQDKATVNAGTLIKTLALGGVFLRPLLSGRWLVQLIGYRSAWILPGSWTPLAALSLA